MERLCFSLKAIKKEVIIRLYLLAAHNSYNEKSILSEKTLQTHIPPPQLLKCHLTAGLCIAY